MSKERIQKAFGDSGKKLVDLVKVCEQHGHELTEAEFNKGFTWLQNTLQTVLEKAKTARALAVAANGAFSFDMEMPEPSASPTPSVFPGVGGPLMPVQMQIPAAAMAPIPIPGPRAVGRVAKSATEGAGEVVFDTPERPKPIADMLDKSAEISFIE